MNALKNLIDADLAQAEYTPSTPLPDGTYPAFVSNIQVKKFTSGSQGVEVTYTIAGDSPHKGRTIRDYIVTQKADGSVDERGRAMVKKLLVEGGYTTKQIKEFQAPEVDSNLFGGFKDLLEKPFNIEVKARVNSKGPQAGKSFARINTFRARE